MLGGHFANLLLLLLATAGLNLRMKIQVSCPDGSRAVWPHTLCHPPEEVYDPLIFHIKCEKSYTDIFSLTEEETELPSSLIRDLISFGAIYTLQPKQTIEKNAGSTKATRLLNPSERIEKGSYVRVHVNPKRYPLALDVNWKERIVYSDENLVCVDKPSGIPCSEGVDNRIENLVAQVKEYYSFESLQVTGRLDTCTSGLVILSRNSNSSSMIHGMNSRRQLKKRYTVLCGGNGAGPSVGVLKHCYRKIRRGHRNSKPTLLKPYSPEFLENNSEWNLAELKILRSKKVDGKEVSNVAIAGTEGNTQHGLFECEVELVTGRTHQIRLQFATIGFPLIGDTRYAPVVGLLADDLDGLEVGNFGPDPLRVGLHCSALGVPLSTGVDVLPSLSTGLDFNVATEVDGRPHLNLRSRFQPWWRNFTQFQ